jgi:hypothetical protein
MSLTKENYYEEVYYRFNDKSAEILSMFREDLKLLGIMSKNHITNAIYSENEDEYINLLKKKQLQEYLGFEVEFIAQEGDMVEEGFDPTYNILLRIFNVGNSMRSISYDIKWVADAGKRYKAAQYSEMIEESEIKFIEESISVIEKEFTRIEQQVYKEAIAGAPPAKRAKRTLFRKSRKKTRKSRRKN